MRAGDVAKLARKNLWQRKLRTGLNLVGIVIGCCVLIMTSAGVRGVRDAYRFLFDSSEFARQVVVLSSSWNPEEPPADASNVSSRVPKEPRERIRESLADLWRDAQEGNFFRQISVEEIEKLEGLEHVLSVVPDTSVRATVALTGKGSMAGKGSPAATLFAQVSGTYPSQSLNRSIVVGGPIRAIKENEILVHEFLAYQLGFISDAELDSLLGRDLTITYRISGSQLSSFYSLLTGNWGAGRVHRSTPRARGPSRCNILG
jgi:hypothetical protein